MKQASFFKNMASSRNLPDHMSAQDRVDWVRLARTETIGPVTFHRLISRYGSAGRALEALPDLSAKGGRQKPLSPISEKQAHAEIQMVEDLGGHLITLADPEYPIALSMLEDAPPVLTVLGNLHLLSRPCIGMVGARNASLNGKKMAETLARDCGQNGGADGGVVVVSGLARGIDAAVHKGALEGGTIAVLGGGADVIYPRENEKLYHEIRARGVILAENPVGWQPRAQDFPRRNRIISGLSAGVVVVEANMRSGSLITARLAGEQGRDVFAVPGFPGDPRAQGPNSLLKDGAILVQNAQDILEAIRPSQTSYSLEERQKGGFSSPADPDYQIDHYDDIHLDDGAREEILGNLSYTPIGVDELLRACQSDNVRVNIALIQEALLELELAGRLSRHPGNRVSLV